MIQLKNMAGAPVTDFTADTITYSSNFETDRFSNPENGEVIVILWNSKDYPDPLKIPNWKTSDDIDYIKVGSIANRVLSSLTPNQEGSTQSVIKKANKEYSISQPPVESYYKGLEDEIHTIAQTEPEINPIKKQLAHIQAVMDIDNRALPNSGKFYDLFDGSNNYSIGHIDDSLTELKTDVPGGSTKLKVKSLSTFEVGQEISITGDYKKPTKFDFSGSLPNQINYPAAFTEKQMRDGVFDDTGLRFWTVDFQADIYEYSLSAPYDIDNKIFVKKINHPFTVSGNVRWMKLFNNGTLLAINDVNSSNQTVWFTTLSTPYDIESFGAFEAKTIGSYYMGLDFNLDGTKMYSAYSNSNFISEWELTEPWNISTKTNQLSYNIPAGWQPYDVSWSDDGKKLFYLEWQNEYIYSIDFPVPWVIANGVVSDSFNPPIQNNNCYAFKFLEDGKRLLTIDHYYHRFMIYNTSQLELANEIRSEKTNVVSLNTIYDGNQISNIQYLNKSYNADHSIQRGIFISPDGKYLFTVSQSNDYLFRQELSVPFDINTKENLTSFYIGSWVTTPSSITFSPDGMRFWVCGDGSKVYQFNCTDSFVIENDVSYAGYYSVLTNGGINASKDIQFKPDGTKAYVLGSTQQIWEYDLPEAWNFLTAVWTSKKSNGLLGSTIVNFNFSNDGMKLIWLSSADAKIHILTLPNAYNTDSIPSSSEMSYTFPEDSQPYGFCFDYTETRLYMIGNQNNKVYQYSAGEIVYEIETNAITNSYISGSFVARSLFSSIENKLSHKEAGYVLSEFIYSDKYLDHSTEYNAMHASCMCKDDAVLFLATNTGDKIYQYSLVNGDLNTAQYTGKYFNVTHHSLVSGIAVSPDGLTMILCDSGSHYLYQYTFTTAFDISTLNYTRSQSSISGVTTANAIFIPKAGNKIITLCKSSRKLVEHTLNIAWSIENVTYVGQSGSFTHSPADTQMTGMIVNEEGKEVFLLGNQYDRIDKFTINDSFDVNSLTAIDESVDVTNITNCNDMCSNSAGTKFYIFGSPVGRQFSTSKNIGGLSLDLYYNITSPLDIQQIATWVEHTKLSGTTVDIAVSLVGENDPENFQPTTETVQPNYQITGYQETEALFDGVTPKAKATVRITLNRAAMTDNVKISKILGAID